MLQIKSEFLSPKLKKWLRGKGLRSKVQRISCSCFTQSVTRIRSCIKHGFRTTRSTISALNAVSDRNSERSNKYKHFPRSLTLFAITDLRNIFSWLTYVKKRLEITKGKSPKISSKLRLC